MGIVFVASCNAWTAGVPDVTMTFTLSFANSAAISAKRSACPSTQRYSIATVRPSIQPSSRSRCTKASVHSLAAARVLGTRNPMVGSLPACCALAASGQAAAAPPSAASNSRRPMVTVIRPSRARCVEGTIPRHERAVLTTPGRTEAHSVNVRLAPKAVRRPIKNFGNIAFVGKQTFLCPRLHTHYSERAASRDPWTDRCSFVDYGDRNSARTAVPDYKYLVLVALPSARCARAVETYNRMAFSAVPGGPTGPCAP